MTFDSLAELLKASGQEHLVRFRDTLAPAQRAQLESQIEQVDFELINRLWREAGDSQAAHDESPAQKARRAVPPAELIRTPRDSAQRQAWQAARAEGEKLLRAGRVGVILVAGGEGTRLGFPHPKGMFPIGVLSHKSLFQLLAEQALARSRRAGRAIPYYVMTSRATHEETVDFFERHGYFGLNRADVQFFSQGNMPAVDRETGKLLLSAPDELALNPDGHGGLLAALSRSKVLDDMRRRGVDYLFYHQVDNPLVAVCDPAFLGFHAARQAEISTKVVAKLTPAEKMGVVVDIDGRTQIIEYSDLPEELAGRRDAAGEIALWAGNTAVHVFSRSLFERLQRDRVELPFHRAIKKVPFIDESGRPVEPAGENAMKFERFIFDVLPLAERSLVVEAQRNEEFCPLKNQSGEFSPEHVRESMSQRFAAWLRAAGAKLPDGLPVEISPLYALDADELAGKVAPGKSFEGPIHLA